MLDFDLPLGAKNMASENKRDADRQTPSGSVVGVLIPIMGAVFTAFLVTGLALPVLPLHVNQGLGFGAFVVGLVSGAQFTASLLSRFWSGHYADSQGSKKAVVAGLWIAVAAGFLYLLSMAFHSSPAAAVTILIAGRGVLGAAESCIVTGALSWGLVLAGHQNTGKVIAWIGTAMYVAFALGAPVGSALYGLYDFTAIALATILLPLLTLALVAWQPAVPPSAREHPGFASVVRAVWMPGFGMALSSIGFCTITTFLVLLFAERGWGLGWLALTIFAGAFILARIFFGHLADHIGGAKVALVCVLIEAVGQAVIWLSPWPAAAFAGAAITGFGYSLVYPGFGVEAVKRVPAENRGLAMGAYSAFLDVALGFANPALGLIAHGFSLKAVFLVSTLVVISAVGVAARLLSDAG
jgi:MFS family permease